MFGWSELLVVMLLALILLGPDKLADVARTLGRIYGEYQKAKKRLELELIYGKPEEGDLFEIRERRIEEVKGEVREYLNKSGFRGVG